MDELTDMAKLAGTMLHLSVAITTKASLFSVLTYQKFVLDNLHQP
jgi:hypothetical protein